MTNRSYQHPDAIQTLLKSLFENRSLTVLQYDHIIKYLNQRRDVQVKAEIGEDACEVSFTNDPPSITQPYGISSVNVAPPPVASNIEKPAINSDLQKKIFDILGKKSFTEKIAQKAESKTKLSDNDKDELKQKILKDEKVKLALNALLGRKN